mgnify:CR=1 FL=1
MKHIRYIIAVLAATLALSCGKENPQQEEETPKQSFDIQIQDLHSSYCKVSVTPEDKNTPYFLGVTTEAYFNEFGSMDNLEETVTNFIETQIIMNPELSIAELMHKGDYTREVTGLQPEQTFIVFACHTDAEGAVISEIKLIKETTPPVTKAELTFEIEIDQITATSAMLFITPSTDDQYVWLELPEFVYKGMTNDELEAFLLKNYKAFFGLHATTGEMMYSFDNKLDPDTEYMVIAFGYDGGITTDLATKKFRTLKPNDPTDVTFEFSYANLTSRSVDMTFIPSDNTVSYLAIVVDEATLERSGGATEDGVKKLIDKEIKKAIAFGDCEDRAEFAQFNSQRGKQTGSFAVTAGMKHYACAVCVNEAGEYASQVGIAEFVAPTEGATDASATASFDKWFDGDALAAADAGLYGDYAGWAVLPIRFTLEESAVDVIYTIYPVAIIEEEGATDEMIREILLDNSLLGEYNFYAESREDVQLEWNCAYRLYMVALDANDNAGELVSMDIPALTRSGASPISEF